MKRVRRSRGRGPAKGRTRRGKKHRGIWYWIVSGTKLFLACAILWGFVAAVYYGLSLRYNLDELSKMPERTVLYDNRDRFYTRFSGENRIVIPYAAVSPSFLKALLAREDTRFFQHAGVDPLGIARAALRNLLMGGIRQGGSTITQQLARNSFPLGGRNYHRKLLEAALSFRIETELSKEEILEHYMNRIYFGSGCYGIEAASQTYFGKSASALSLAESALLAGLIRSPTRLSPLNNPEDSVVQRDVVLRRMRDVGFVTTAEMEAALAEPLRVVSRPNVVAPAENWAVDAVRRELELLLAPLGMETGGLSIYTTIDPALQTATEQAIATRLQSFEASPRFNHPSRVQALEAGSSDYLQAAAVVMDHRNGGLLAIAGGRDYGTSTFHRALFGRRQAGSSVKPFLLAHALTKGLSVKDPVSDERLAPAEIPKKFGPYDPTNPDGEYRASRPARDMVVHSRNPMAVRIGLRSGLEGFVGLVRRAGLAEGVQPTPAVALGAFETSLRDLTSAMTAFPNDGNQVHPFVIRRIVDAQGKTIYSAKQIRTPLLEPRAAREVAGVMEEVLTRGTGAGARSMGLRGRAAGKTGTTNAFFDAWFVGFTGNLTSGVWAGFDKPRTIAPGAGGSQIALPIWVDIMSSPAASRYR